MDKFDKLTDLKRGQIVKALGAYRDMNDNKLHGMAIFIKYNHEFNLGGKGPWCFIQIEGRITPWPLSQIEV